MLQATDPQEIWGGGGGSFVITPWCVVVKILFTSSHLNEGRALVDLSGDVF